jgi:hypothetical protein
MYRADREAEYTRLIGIYNIPTDLITGRYNGALIYINTYSRMIYSLDGQAIGQFRH